MAILGRLVIYPMPEIMLGVDEVRGALGRVKKGKQPGPDKLNREIYNSLEDGERLVMHLIEACVLEDVPVPDKCKRSRTVMIPKTRKPRA